MVIRSNKLYDFLHCCPILFFNKNRSPLRGFYNWISEFLYKQLAPNGADLVTWNVMFVMLARGFNEIFYLKLSRNLLAQAMQGSKTPY
jgi:hypothetical protein